MSDRKKRLNLFNENKNCYYCNVETRFVDYICDEQATIEHIWNNLDGCIILEKLVNSCYKCNTNRSKNVARLRKIAKEQLMETYSQFEYWNPNKVFQSFNFE